MMLRLILLASVMASAMAVTCESGPGQAGSASLDGVCYYLVTSPEMTWDEAKRHCANTYSNGLLAKITSQAINDVLEGLMDDDPGNPKAWFGLSKDLPGNDLPMTSYEWVDFEAFDSNIYENFNPGEHTNRPNDSDKCVYMQQGQGKWFNRECEDDYSVLCQGDPVDNGGIQDPHLMVQIAGSDDPVCFDLKGQEGEKYQLIYDPERDLTINCDILQYQNTSHSWFKAIAIMEDDCEVTMDVRKIIVNGQSISWDIPSRDQECGRSATYTVTPEGHLVVQMAGKLQLTLRRDMAKRYNVHFLDFYVTQHHDLSPLSHGILGQFQGAKISVKPMNKKNNLLKFENDSTKPMTVVTRRMRKSVLPSANAMACWFSGFQGYGIIEGVPSDYLVESLTFRGIAPNLEQFAKFDVNGAPGDDVIDGLF